MHFALADILAVSAIGLLALVFLIRLFFKMRKNKCITVCSGCSGDSCSTKSFAATNSAKTIQIHKV